MSQIDPYRLIGHDPAKEGIPGPEVLKKARRKVLAQFELQSDVQATINGIRLTKNDAIKALDELEDPARARELARFYTNPALRKLRDKPTLMLLVGMVRKGKIDYADIPPELANSIAEKADFAIRNFFKAGVYAGVTKSLDIVGRISDSHRERAARGLRVLLGETEVRITKAQELLPETREFRKEVSSLADKLSSRGLARMLNQLPSSMSRQTEALAREWMNLLIIAAGSRSTYDKAKGAWPMLSELELSPDNQHLRQRLGMALIRSMPKKRRLRIPWGVAVFILLVTVVVIRNLVLDHTRGPERVEFGPLIEEQAVSTEREVRMVFDSLPGPKEEPKGDIWPTISGSFEYELGLRSNWRGKKRKQLIELKNDMETYDCVLFILSHEAPDSTGQLCDVVYLEAGEQNEIAFSPDSLVSLLLYTGQDWVEGERQGFMRGRSKTQVPRLLKLEADKTVIISIIPTLSGPRIIYQYAIPFVPQDSLPDSK